MAIDYSMTVVGDTLRVKANGRDDSLTEVQQYGLAIVNHAIKAQATKILCDETDLIYALDTFDTFESARFIADTAPKIARVAIACGPNSEADAEFWETVAINRGLQVRFFPTVAEAEEPLAQ